MTPEARERERARSRAYYADNRERRLAYQRERAASMTDAERAARRAYMARWYEANGERHRQRQREAKSALKAWLDSLKRGAGCADCGTREGRLDFDHCPGEVKLFKVADLTRKTRDALEAEIARCDVRCASCHARRHARAR